MADETVKIKFSKAYAVKAKDGPKYKEGQTVSVPVASANHFINRGVAEEVGKESAKAEEPAEEAVDFESMHKPDLEAYAKKHKIEGVTTSMTKEDMVKAIKRAPK